jgi:hypothetical protein
MMDLVSGTGTTFSTTTGRSNRKSGNLSIGAILSICICVFVLSKIFLGTLCYRKWVKQHSTCEIKLSGKLQEVLLHTSKSAICSLLCPGIDQEEIHVEQTRATSVQESEAWGSSERASGSLRILLEPSSCCGSAYDLFCKYSCLIMRDCELAGGKMVMFQQSGKATPSSRAVLRETEKLKQSDVIGSGGFGIVYKLVLDDMTAFAVKKLTRVGGPECERGFERELATLADIKHRNLITLRGYYTTPDINLLLYDLMSNGNLDSLLHGACVFPLQPLSQFLSSWLVLFVQSLSLSLHCFLL